MYIKVISNLHAGTGAAARVRGTDSSPRSRGCDRTEQAHTSGVTVCWLALMPIVLLLGAPAAWLVSQARGTPVTSSCRSGGSMLRSGEGEARSCSCMAAHATTVLRKATISRAKTSHAVSLTRRSLVHLYQESGGRTAHAGSHYTDVCSYTHQEHAAACRAEHIGVGHGLLVVSSIRAPWSITESLQVPSQALFTPQLWWGWSSRPQLLHTPFSQLSSQKPPTPGCRAAVWCC
jgi:hypothetical protein